MSDIGKLQQYNPLPLYKPEAGTPSAAPQENTQPKAPEDKIDLNSLISKKDVTFLFYLDGRESGVGPFVADSIFDLERAGSSDKINIVAQLEKYPYSSSSKDFITGRKTRIPIDNDWKGVRRYVIKHDKHEDLNLLAADKLLKVEKEIPDNPLLQYQIAREYWNNGDKEQAQSHFNRAKELGISDYIHTKDVNKKMTIFDNFYFGTDSMYDDIKDKNKYASDAEILDDNVTINDPAQLQKFIEWGIKEFPADKYVIVFMGHGGGPKGVSNMSPHKVAGAINNGVAKSNKETGRNDKISAIAINTCYGGSAEFLKELENSADVTIASENFGYTNSSGRWGKIVENTEKKLADGKPFDPEEFGNDIVEYFREDINTVKELFPGFEKYFESFPTLAAFRNKKIGAVVDTWKKLSESCKENGVTTKQFFEAVDKSKNFPSPGGADGYDCNYNYYEDLRDMWSIAENVKNSKDTPEKVKKTATDVQKAIEDSIIKEQHVGTEMEGAHGVSIWAPGNAIAVNGGLDAYKENVPGFCENSGWADRLGEDSAQVPKALISDYLDACAKVDEIEDYCESTDLSPGETEEIPKELQEAKEQRESLKQQIYFTFDRNEAS